MTSLSWSERNSGRHGILLPSDDHQNQNQNPLNETFFSSRIKMYLDLLDCIPLSDSWISSLTHIDIDTEVTVPSIGPDCPICYDPYIRIANDTIPTDASDRKEIPLRLPCGHVLCKKCVHRVAWHANASTGVVCPFCRASFNHMPITADSGSWDKLLKCMWVTLETYTRLHYDKDDEQDMEAVVTWAQDRPRLSHDVPPADKREAIQYALRSWTEMGDEKFCRDLAVAVLGPTVQVTPQLVRLRRAHRPLRRPRRASTDGRPTVLIRTGGMRMSRSQDFHASD